MAYSDPATQKQIDLVARLLVEKVCPDTYAALADQVANGQGTKRDASSVIDALFGAPRADTPTTTPELEVGIYRDPATGEYRKVYTTRRGILVAKVASFDVIGNGQARVEWEYVGKRGLVGLSADDRIDAVEAAAFGKLTGTCVYCALKLTDERSLSVGYGPTCAANNGLPWGEVSDEIDAAALRLASAFTTPDGAPSEEVVPPATLADDEAYWAALMDDAESRA